MNNFIENNNNKIILEREKNLEAQNSIIEKLYRQELYNTFERLYNVGLEFYSFTYMFNNFVIHAESHDRIKELRWESIEDRVISYAKNWIKRIPFVVFSYIAIETHEGEGPSKGFPHFHGIFAINPVLPNNGYTSYLNINKLLREIFSEFTDVDIKLNYLKSWKDVYQSMNYVIKFLDLQKHYLFFYKEQALITRIAKPLSDFLYFINEHRLDIEAEFDIRFEYKKPSLKYTFKKIEFVENNYIFFDHFINSRILDDKVILRILHMFMQLEKLYIFNNNFYQKIETSKSSFKFFKTIEDLLNNFEIVTSRLLKEKEIRFHLEYTDLLGILLTYIETAKDKIMKNTKLTLPSIQLYHNICEFKDGFYFMEFDYFLYLKYEKHLDIINKLNLKQLLNTSKFFNKTFHHLSEPYLWINSIKHTMGDNEEEFLKFCKAFGMLMHTKDFHEKKQDNVYIEGDSNTGKTSLVAEVLLHIYGEENVGLMGSNDDNFYLEQAIKQMILICDEFVYKKRNRSDLLRLINRSPVLINRKHKKALFLRNVARSLFLSNKDINKDLLLDEAIKSRLQFFYFRNEAAERTPGFIKQIKSEIPNILVFCNKIFIRSFLDKRLRTETFYKHFNLNDTYDQPNSNLPVIKDN